MSHITHVCALPLVLFSAFAGNIPQTTVTQIEVVGEGNCGATESFFPEHCVLCNMNHTQSLEKCDFLKKNEAPGSLSDSISTTTVRPHLPRLQTTPPVCP